MLVLAAFRVWFLICALSIAHSDCSRETARVSWRGPKVSNELACLLLQGEAASMTADARADPASEYLKITCPKEDSNGETQP